jgi:SMI1/KNR4 family protein SUKH-1
MDEFSATHVLELLTRLQHIRPAVFGSDQHQWALNEPLSENAIAEFERCLSIRLPNEYRSFIARVGNGGAGPYYGVFPLGMVDDNFGLRRWHVNDGLVNDPSKPFALTHEWNDTSAMPSDDLADQDQAEYDRRMENFANAYLRSDRLRGAIPICHQGCALRIWLVVTGEAAGHLWDDRLSEYGGIRPLMLRSGSHATFGTWYIEWLKDCLRVGENAPR